VRTDPHPPHKYRTDGTVSNVPEFAKAFNCSAKAKVCPYQMTRLLQFSYIFIAQSAGRETLHILVDVHLGNILVVVSRTPLQLASIK